MELPYQPFSPHPTLHQRVVAFWAVSREASLPRRILPDGHFDLLFTLSSTGQIGAKLLGVMTRPTDARAPLGTAVIGVTLEVGQALSLIGVPLHQLKDTVVELPEVWGSSARRLSSVLWELPSTETRISYLTEVLLARIGRAPRSTHAGPLVSASLHCLRQHHGEIRTAALARQQGCSERRLERLFRDYVGLSPKVLARIFRFQAAASYLARGNVESLGALACNTGFYDQAHLTNEFRQLSGYSPAQFTRMGVLSDSSNHSFGLQDKL